MPMQHEDGDVVDMHRTRPTLEPEPEHITTTREANNIAFSEPAPPPASHY